MLQFSAVFTGVDTTPHDFTITNAMLPAFPLFGLTVGYGNFGVVTDLGAGSANCLTLTGLHASSQCRSLCSRGAH